jgi:acyl carrier protein
MDAAAARDEAVLVLARLDVAGMRARAGRGEDVPAIWRALAGLPSRPRAVAGAGGAGGLAGQLAALPVPDRDRVLLDLVRGNAAVVLGHQSADVVEAGRAFRELGFDSLTAVELRNRLSAVTGLRLPATLVFDYPTPAAVASHLLAGIIPDTPDTAPAEADESTLRKVLATVPLSRFRDAGLLEALLRLAELSDCDIRATTVQEQADSIDALDAESLVRMALNTKQAD